MKSFWKDKENSREGMRQLAAHMKGVRRRRLRMPRSMAMRLLRMVQRAEDLAAAGAEGEALNRLRGDARRIAACLRSAGNGDGARLPADGDVRVLELARHLVNGGEDRLSRERLCAGIRAFDGKRPLEMGEIQCMPAALRIALCEAITRTAEEIIGDAADHLRARRWTERGGRLPRHCGTAFLAHAQKLAFEEERPELHAFLENFDIDDAQEQLRRRDAACCLRMENLMQLYFLLEAVDWQRCFEELSPVEEELRADTVYPHMDDTSRAELRSCLAALARRLDAEEITRGALCPAARPGGERYCLPLHHGGCGPYPVG